MRDTARYRLHNTQPLTCVPDNAWKIRNYGLVGSKMVEIETSSRCSEANGTTKAAMPAYVVVVEEYVATIAHMITYEHHLERCCLIRLQYHSAAQYK